MTLVCDPTNPLSLLIGLVHGDRVRVHRYTRSTGKHMSIIQCVARFLRMHNVLPERVRSVVIVTGRGRFSDLRDATTIANCFALAQSCRLYTVNPQRHTFASDEACVRSLFQQKRQSRMVKPRYDRMPSITSPKRGAHNAPSG